MRKCNAVISMVITVLFFLHAIVGGFQLAGLMAGGSEIMSFMAWFMVVLISVHMLIGIKLTVDTLMAMKRSGASYVKENKLFWVRRISGFAIFLLMLYHIFIFIGNHHAGAYRLNYFGGIQLATQILLVLSIAIHVISNVKPVLIAFGMKSMKEYAIDILMILSILFLLMGIGFCIYYVRWKMF